MTQPTEGHRRVSARMCVVTYLAMLALTTLSLTLSQLTALDSLPIVLAISVALASLTMLYFMHLIEESFTAKLAMVLAMLLVILLVFLTTLDPLTRAHYLPLPGKL